MANLEHGPLPDIDPNRGDRQLSMQLLEHFLHAAPVRMPVLLGACQHYSVAPYRQGDPGELGVRLVATGDIPTPRYVAVTSHSGDERRASLHTSPTTPSARRQQRP